MSEAERYGPANRELWRRVFIRVCHDSGFKLPMVQAAALTGKIVGASALEIWTVFPYLKVMEEIAAGTHPAAHNPELARAA